MTKQTKTQLKKALFDRGYKHLYTSRTTKKELSDLYYRYVTVPKLVHMAIDRHLLRYVEGIISPPGFALLRGKNFHKTRDFR
jgi:hypothetical protein